MISINILVLSISTVHVSVAIKLADVVFITLWVAGFLCVLNVGLALLFRRRHMSELLSYSIACVLELGIFIAALLFHMGIISHIPYPLPPGLAFNRAEIVAAIALAIGLFPAAYWHRAPFSELPGRIARDGQVMKEREGSVRVHSNVPDEWMN